MYSFKKSSLINPQVKYLGEMPQMAFWIEKKTIFQNPSLNKSFKIKSTLNGCHKICTP